MSNITIYHNPRCSKSRQTLAILEEHNIQPEIVLYLEDTPSKQKLQELLKQLGKKPRDILRKSEDAYKEMGLSDTSLSDDDLLNAMLSEPKLIERPIVVSGSKAVLGRPPENVLELIS
jgi:arsenate reductase